MKFIDVVVIFLLGFGAAIIVCHLTVIPRYKLQASKSANDVDRISNLYAKCVNSLDDAHATNVTCTRQTEEAIRVGEECVTLLYVMPLDIIQQVRDAFQAGAPAPNTINPTPPVPKLPLQSL